MDDHRFDALLRTLYRAGSRRGALTAVRTRTTSRRAVLPLLGGLLLAGLGPAPEAQARMRRRRCRPGTTRCSRADRGCFDLQRDPTHCGNCFTVCALGQGCFMGRCIGGGCTPDCVGAVCGASDGCGGRCSQGSCAAGQTCGGGGIPNACGGGCTPSCGDKACGDDGCGGSCGDCPAGQRCTDNGRCVPSGGGGCTPACLFNQVCQNGTCVAAADICAGPTGICNADPTPCGQAATGETCGCERTVEGNNVCVNGVNACTDVECTSSQDCRDTVGFHFFCQEAKTNAQGQFCGCGFGTATGRVCVAECDNIT